MELQMTALARSIARAFPANSQQINIARQAVCLVLASLFVAMLVASYGLDLSPGFF